MHSPYLHATNILDLFLHAYTQQNVSNVVNNFFILFLYISDEFQRLPQGNISELNIYSRISEAVSRRIVENAEAQGVDYKTKTLN